MRIYPLNLGLAYAFLVETPSGLLLVDGGGPGQENVVLAKMKALGRSDLKLIWITHAHYDHYGSAAALRERTGALIGTHPADAESLSAGHSLLGRPRGRGWLLRLAQPLVERIWPLRPTRPDFTLEDGQTLARYGLDAAVLHTPGHTPGHTCLLLPGGTAFAADLVARVPDARLQDRLATDWTQLPTSLARFKAHHPVWSYTGHSARPLSWAELERIRP